MDVFLQAAVRLVRMSTQADYRLGGSSSELAEYVEKRQILMPVWSFTEYLFIIINIATEGKKRKFVGHLQTETSANNITWIAEPGEAVLRNSLQKSQ